MLVPESSPSLRSPVRPAVESIVDVLESHTQIIRNLWALEPKAPRSRVRWVLLLAVLAVVGVLALDGSVREVARTQVGAARARIALIRHGRAPAPVAQTTSTPAAAPVVAQVTQATQATQAAAPAIVAAPVVKVVSAPVVPAAKKAAARRHGKGAQK